MGKREALAIPLSIGYVLGLDFMLTGRDTKDSTAVRHAIIDEIEAD